MHTEEERLPTGLQLTALDRSFRECPHQNLDRLRGEDPVHCDRELGRVFLTRFEDVKAAVSNRSLSADPRKAPPDSYLHRSVIGKTPIEEFKPTMVHQDDPDHKRIRGLVASAFTPRAVEEFRPRIHKIASELLDDLSERESFDVIAEYATPLPIIVIAEMLGIDSSDVKQFKTWSDARTQIFNPARTPQQTAELAAAQRGLSEYFASTIKARRRERRNDLISALVAAEESGDRLSEEEIITTCNLLLVAGNATTTDLIGNGVLALLEHPKQLVKLRRNSELITNTVEEILRFDAPVAQTNRVALDTVVVGGTELPRGTVISASLLAAGRDPSQHANPHSFDIERANTSHAAFGGGAHYCLGAPLARAEARIGLSLLFERFPKMRLSPEHGIEHKPVPVFNGLKALWVRTG